ncbi:hypothetical protein MBLNU13_g10398t1 [Cladosporium sp. NU13]
MRFSHVAVTALLSLTVSGAPTISDDTAIADLAKQAYDKTTEQLSQAQKRSSEGGSCSLKNIRVRREWGTLSKSQRKDYIKAVQCLQEKPARTPSAVASGAKTRFDDFVATHINQTLTIHYTANFLSWHRYFTWLYEEALRKECGFQGDQPYWDWAKTAHSGLLSSPIFDGSDTSMSGNGAHAYGPNETQIILGASQGLPPVYLSTGNGGGCVQSGPFANMSVNLGPFALDIPGGVSVGPPSGNALDYNPRCLKRDLVDEVNQRYANASSVLSLITKSKTVYDFQMTMQGVPGSGDIGVHGGGHYTLGGDPGNDVFTSPGDPAFYLHHGMIDRVWWIWQMLSPNERQFTSKAIAGTQTFLDTPPSANGTLDDQIEFGYAAGPARPIRDLLSTVSGPFCYVYL